MDRQLRVTPARRAGFSSPDRPDLQYTLGDQRYYVEWDRASSNRGPIHEERLYANDPAGRVELLKLG